MFLKEWLRHKNQSPPESNRRGGTNLFLKIAETVPNVGSFLGDGIDVMNILLGELRSFDKFSEEHPERPWASFGWF
jgi:hypothetical protein